MLAAHGFRVLGIDRNNAYLDIAKRHYSCNGAEFSQYDLDKDDWLGISERFEAVTCFETLEHVHQPDHLINGAYHLLQERGVLLLSVPNIDYERFDETGNNKDPFHINTFRRNDLLHLIKGAGFYVAHEYGQDICNRALSATTILQEKGVSHESLSGLRSGVNTQEEVILASRILGYPSKHAITHSYSHIFACRKNK